MDGQRRTRPAAGAADPWVAPHRGTRAGPADIRVRRDDPDRRDDAAECVAVRGSGSDRNGAPPPPPAPPQPGSGFEVTNVEDGAVFAPDVKFTEVNHEFATLVGAYAGYVFGGEGMLGGGGYSEGQSPKGSPTRYGEPVVEWRALR